MRTSIIVGVLVAVGAAGSTGLGACKVGQGGMAGEVHLSGTSSLGVLLRFAYDNHVCMGIENPGAELLVKAPVRVDFPSSRVTDLIQRVVDPAKYRISEREGVVLVQNIGRSNPNAQLDVILPEYTTGRMSVAWANLAVFTRLLLLANPSLQGFAGGVMDGAPEDQVGPFDEHGRSARDIVTLITGQSNGAAWVSGSCREVARGDSGPCWTLLRYHVEPDAVDSLINDLVDRLYREQVSARPLAQGGGRGRAGKP